MSRVTFDPDSVSYRELLDVFFSTHDPTTLNRQGADVGSQYRSVVFYHDEGQKKVAEEVIRELTEARVFEEPIVTEVAPFKAFYPAEDYHKKYFERNRFQPYCQVVIAPKLAKLRAHHRDRLKPTAEARQG